MVFYFGLFGSALAVLGILLSHSNSPMVFLVPTGASAIIILSLSAVLMHFGVFGSLRQSKVKQAFGSVGLVLAVIGVVGFVNPLYFGLFRQYIPLADQFGLLACGIGFMSAWLESPRPSLDHKLVQFMKERYSDKLEQVKKLGFS